MMLSCSEPSTTPEMPPRKPNITSDRNMPAKAGLSQGAFLSHSNMPLTYPFLRWAASIAPGTVMPWMREPSTAR